MTTHSGQQEKEESDLGIPLLQGQRMRDGEPIAVHIEVGAVAAANNMAQKGRKR